MRSNTSLDFWLRSTRSLSLPLLLALSGSVTCVAFAQAQTGEPTRTPTATQETASQPSNAEQAVRAMFAEYMAAFNQQDVATLSARWQPQGEFLNEDTRRACRWT